MLGPLSALYVPHLILPANLCFADVLMIRKKKVKIYHSKERLSDLPGITQPVVDRNEKKERKERKILSLI